MLCVVWPVCAWACRALGFALEALGLLDAAIGLGPDPLLLLLDLGDLVLDALFGHRRVVAGAGAAVEADGHGGWGRRSGAGDRRRGPGPAAGGRVGGRAAALRVVPDGSWAAASGTGLGVAPRLGLLLEQLPLLAARRLAACARPSPLPLRARRRRPPPASLAAPLRAAVLRVGFALVRRSIAASRAARCCGCSPLVLARRACAARGRAPLRPGALRGRLCMGAGPAAARRAAVSARPGRGGACAAAGLPVGGCRRGRRRRRRLGGSELRRPSAPSSPFSLLRRWMMLTTSKRSRIATTRPATKYSTLSLTKLPAARRPMAGDHGARSYLIRALEFALDLATHVTVRDLAPPVAPLLARGQRQLDLRPRSLEVDPGRDQGQAALRRFADQALDLGPVQEQLARPLRLVVLAAGRLVGRDVEVAQPDLARRRPPRRRRSSAPCRCAATSPPSRAARSPPRSFDQLEFVPGAAVGGDVARGRAPLLLGLLAPSR